MKQEIKRKALHLISLIFPISLIFLDRYQLVAIIYLSVVSIINILLDKFRTDNKNIISKIYHLFFGDILREHEKAGKLTGATNYFISLTLAYSIYHVLLHKPLEHVLIAYIGFMLGDAGAALVGKSIGKIKLIMGKTLEGSIACFAVSFATTFWISSENLLIPLKIASLITLFELIAYKIDDNFFVPLSTLALLFFIV